MTAWSLTFAFCHSNPNSACAAQFHNLWVTTPEGHKVFSGRLPGLNKPAASICMPMMKLLGYYNVSQTVRLGSMWHWEIHPGYHRILSSFPCPSPSLPHSCSLLGVSLVSCAQWRERTLAQDWISCPPVCKEPFPACPHTHIKCSFPIFLAPPPGQARSGR